MNRRLLVMLAVLSAAGFASCPGAIPPAVAGGSCEVADGGATDGTATCEVSTQALLQCQSGTYAVLSDCRGDGGCAISNGTVTCDTSANSLGSHCADEGFARCAPDNAQLIMACDGGVLGAVFTCTSRSRCGYTDAGGVTCL